MIDVGAAEGEVTRVCAEAVGPTGRVWALEPNPRHDPALRALMTTLPQIAVRPVAAGSPAGMRPVFQSINAKQASLYQALTKRPTTGAWEMIVPVIELDTFRDVSAVKIDAQGAEVEILRGATTLLRTCPFWVLEVWPHGLRTAGTSAVALWQQLTAAGLSPFWMDDQPVTEAEALAYQTDTVGEGPYSNWVARR